MGNPKRFEARQLSVSAFYLESDYLEIVLNCAVKLSSEVSSASSAALEKPKNAPEKPPLPHASTNFLKSSSGTVSGTGIETLRLALAEWEKLGSQMIGCLWI